MKKIDLRKATDLICSDLFYRMEDVEFGTIDKNEKIIGKIHKVLKDGNTIFLLAGELETYKSIIISDSNYKIRNVIDRIGKGPGEYASIRDFAINSDEKVLVILDLQQKKIMRFDYNGKFIDEISPGFRAERLIYHDSCYFFFTNKYPNKLQIKSELIVTDRNFNVIKSYITHNQEHPYTFLSDIVFTEDKSNNSAYFSNVFRDTIFKIAKKGIFPILSIAYANSFPPEYSKDLDSFVKYQYDYWFFDGCFISNAAYLSFQVNENGPRKMYLYDKRVDSLFRIEQFGTHNQKWNFRYPIYCDSVGNYFSIIDAIYLYESRALWKNQFSKDTNLIKFLNELSVDDNPCILRFKLR